MRSTLLTLCSVAAIGSACTVQQYPIPITHAAVDSVSQRMSKQGILPRDTAYQVGAAHIEERVHRDSKRSTVEFRCHYRLSSLESLDIAVRDASDRYHQGVLPIHGAIKNGFSSDYVIRTCARIHDALAKQ